MVLFNYHSIVDRFDKRIGCRHRQVQIFIYASGRCSLIQQLFCVACCEKTLASDYFTFISREFIWKEQFKFNQKITRTRFFSHEQFEVNEEEVEEAEQINDHYSYRINKEEEN
jgi:hypothetical protein